ncbi:MAG: AraC family transcriptional regulator [Eubacteriales bacterium]|nr:AraC family transcriptional regulator [Eubacteriales bacterium]
MNSVNYDLLLAHLSAWDKDELLYQDYYCTEKTIPNLQAFYQKYQHDPESLFAAAHPETLPAFRSEDDFIGKTKNVYLIKHPRYAPFYLHSHGYFEMIYVISGRCTQKFQDHICTLQTGDVCVLSPEIQHGIEVFDESVVLNILVRRSTFLDIFMNALRDKTRLNLFFLESLYAKKKIPYLLFHTDGDETIRNYILDMYLEQMNTDEYSDRIICSILTIFFTQLTRRHGKHIEYPRNRVQRNDSDEQILSYMMNHYDTVTLQTLSEKFHFSPSYCSKLIKSFSGRTFSELLTAIRLSQGENLLLLSQLSVAAISERIGYQNPETFIRSFQRQYGMSPSQYRRSRLQFQGGNYA